MVLGAVQGFKVGWGSMFVGGLGRMPLDVGSNRKKHLERLPKTSCGWAGGEKAFSQSERSSRTVKKKTLGSKLCCLKRTRQRSIRKDTESESANV